jgi:hypothetical protein
MGWSVVGGLPTTRRRAWSRIGSDVDTQATTTDSAAGVVVSEAQPNVNA